LVAEAPFGGLAGGAYWDRVSSRGGGSPAAALVARLPHGPRCKLCRAPSQGWGGRVAAFLGYRFESERLICRKCAVRLASNPGDGIAEVSVLHAEIRQRGEVAPNWPPFALLAVEGIEAAGGIVDAFTPSGAHAFFIGRGADDDHAARAYDAVAALFVAAADTGVADGTLDISVGVSSGRARVGTVHVDDGVDFTATGDIVEMAHGLAAAASTGEALVALDSWRQHSGAVAQSRMRTVPIPGRFVPIDAVVVRGSMEATI